VNAPHRRGACPGLSAPMPTGDGLLVRLMPAQPIPLDAFIAFCTAAGRHGNGTIEITARGSLQVRGLTPSSAAPFASAVAALGISAHDIAANGGVPVVADPLPADPTALIDATALASTVRSAIADARLALAPKVSVVIDGGGRLHLDALAADVRLRAVGPAQAPRLHIAIGGDAASATPLGSITPARAAAVVIRLLGVIARQRHAARASDVLRADGIAAFRSAVDGCISAAPHLPRRPPAQAIAQHPLRDGTVALGVALAFGHAHADALCELARIDALHGVRAVRPAPGRALLLIGVAQTDATALAAEALGFVTRADDLRLRIVACPGKPACASGLIAARALATEVAPHLPPRSATIHISGCAKGCAHPAAAALTVVGTERGCGIVRNGSARAAPLRHVDPAEIVTEIVAEIAGMARASSEAAHG
jgi:precorrin-3B synthase